MKLGKVGKDDVAYEPGPGDGRMLIAAVKKGAKKGVGIETRPEEGRGGEGERQEGRAGRQDHHRSRATR